MNQSQPSELFIPTSFHFPHPLAAAKEDQGTNQLRTSERRIGTLSLECSS